MKKDIALEELFLAQRPQFDDKEEFMSRLTRKLDAVEYLRQYEETNLRYYKYALLATFVAGIVVGGALLAYILSVPSELPLFTFHTSSAILSAIGQSSRTLVTVALSLTLGFGIISIVHIILSIVQMMALSGNIAKDS